MMKSILFGVILITGLFACREEEGRPFYKYEQNFAAYLKEAFGLTMDSINKKYVFLVPINSCSPCVEKTLYFLNDRKSKSIMGIVLGKSEKDRLRFDNIFANMDYMYLDLKSIHSGYELGIFNPVLIYVENNKVIRFDALDVMNFEKKTRNLP